MWTEGTFLLKIIKKLNFFRAHYEERWYEKFDTNKVYGGKRDGEKPQVSYLISVCMHMVEPELGVIVKGKTLPPVTKDKKISPTS